MVGSASIVPKGDVCSQTNLTAQRRRAPDVAECTGTHCHRLGRPSPVRQPLHTALPPSASPILWPHARGEG